MNPSCKPGYKIIIIISANNVLRSLFLENPEIFCKKTFNWPIFAFFRYFPWQRKIAFLKALKNRFLSGFRINGASEEKSKLLGFLKTLDSNLT